MNIYVYVLYAVMGTDPVPLFILLCDPFTDPDPQFVTRSFRITILSFLPDDDIIYIFN